MSLLKNPLTLLSLAIIVAGYAGHSHVAELGFLLLALRVLLLLVRLRARTRAPRAREKTPGTIRLQAPR